MNGGRMRRGGAGSPAADDDIAAAQRAFFLAHDGARRPAPRESIREQQRKFHELMQARERRSGRGGA